MVGETQYADFLELLYGAAVEQQNWERVIATFADMIGGARVWMPDLRLSDGQGGGVVARIDPAAQATYFQYFARRNPFVQPVIGNPNVPWPLDVKTDEDSFPKDEFVRTEYFNDFLKPQDIHSCLVVRLGRRNGVQSTLNVTRPGHREQFGGADLELARRLHPDLIRAFYLSRKFADLGAFAAGLTETLDRSLHGVVLLDDAGRVVHVNATAERLLKEAEGLRVVHGALSASANDAARRLEALIAQAAGRTSGSRTGGSMALATPTRATPLSITVAPIRAERFTGFHSGQFILVCITDLEAGVRLPEQRLRDLFGLTPAEARVALALFEGLTPREAAESCGVSVHTIHVQLARIFDKTGVSRQSELVRLMMRAVGLGDS